MDKRDSLGYVGGIAKHAASDYVVMLVYRVDSIQTTSAAWVPTLVY
jgi:hypothetical protein